MRLKTTHFRYEPKATTNILVSDQAQARATWLDYWELTKPRLSLLSVITAIVGYLVALPQKDASVLVNLIAGTTLAAGGAAVLNQWLEHEADARMARTWKRPIPAGAIAPAPALVFGLILCASGDAILWAAVNSLAAGLAIATQVSYLLIYTPLKKYTPWSTEVGAIPGALPPLIGWAGAKADISLLGWILFAILLCWQIPHFMAIAWTYREDYREAGFPVVSTIDRSGHRCARQALVFTVLLLISSLLPSVLGFATLFYTAIAGISGAWFLYRAICFQNAAKRESAAKRLFVASITYLPIVLAALVFDRLLLL